MALVQKIDSKWQELPAGRAVDYFIDITQKQYDVDGNEVLDEEGNAVTIFLPNQKFSASYETVASQWEEPERNNIGVFSLDDNIQTPEGQMISSKNIEEDEFGIPFWKATFEEIPERIITNEDINVERARRILQGFVAILSDGKRIRIEGNDETTRNLQALAFASQLRISQGGAALITTYRSADNEDFELKQPQVIELWSKGASYVESLYPASWDLKTVTPMPSNYTDDLYWPEHHLPSPEEGPTS